MNKHRPTVPPESPVTESKKVDFSLYRIPFLAGVIFFIAMFFALRNVFINEQQLEERIKEMKARIGSQVVVNNDTLTIVGIDHFSYVLSNGVTVHPLVVESN